MNTPVDPNNNVRQFPRADEANGYLEAEGDTSQVARRRRRLRSGYRNERKWQRLQLALVVLGCALVLAIIIAGSFIARMSVQRDELVFEIRRLERDLSIAMEDAERLRQERDTLVENRIPGIRKLRYDETIPVEDDYVRNISFTLSKRGEAQTHEFRIVLSNGKHTSVLPNVNILLFDELGIQLGTATITVSELSESGESPTLEPGEVRSHYGEIELNQDREPRYFAVDIH